MDVHLIDDEYNMQENLNEFQKYPIKDNGCIVASDHRAVKRGSTSGAASLFLYEEVSHG
jgi:hypothetical protein